ncbi:MAG: protein translocase subunit SecF [Anaerolineae bacterium]|nr:protein translocase subunit SecF [Anaerolineae bacterium]
MFNFVQRRGVYYLISTSIIVLGIAAMVYSTVLYGSPVRLSIDFKGGSLFVVNFTKPATETAIRDVYTDFGQDDPIIQQYGAPEDNAWQIRAGHFTPDEQVALKAALTENVAPIDEDQSIFDVVDPSIGGEVTRAAIFAVLAAGIIILGFIWFAFRRVPHAVRYGACAIVAMFHDILIAMGAMAALGIIFGWEVDALFLTAMLTVVGYSVQDTIVVFDRIRENLPKHRGDSYEMIVNRSVLETVHRSLATQLNAIFVMVAILLFGGATIKQFIAILLIGLASGTYSSIFNAVPLLVSWEKGELPFTKKAAEA